MSTDPPEAGESMLDDDELLERAKRAANGRKFTLLFEEGWESRAVRRRYDRRRYARIALLVMLRWWARHDTGQVRRLFRRSALWHDDLERYRDLLRDLERTASSLLGDACYDPASSRSGTEAALEEGSPVEGTPGAVSYARPRGGDGR